MNPILTLIQNEVKKIPGLKKQQDGSIWVCCPFHREKTPSCVINANPNKITNRGKLPLGTFNCFGCPAKGSWNVLAEKAGLAKLGGYSEDKIFVTRYNAGDVAVLRNNLLSQQELTLEALLEEMHIELYYDVLPIDSWRTISGKILSKVGAKFYHDQQEDTSMLLLPVVVGGDYVGGIRCRMEKEEGKTSYINKKGPWIKESGLFPYDYVVSQNPKDIVLVEGPRDSLRMNAQGIPTLSIMGTQTWSDEKCDLLLSTGADRIIVFMDGDKPGVSATNKIKKSLKNKVDLKVIKSARYNHLVTDDKKLDPGNAPKSFIREHVLPYIR